MSKSQPVGGCRLSPHHSILSSGPGPGSWDSVTQQESKCQTHGAIPQAIHSALHPLSKSPP